MTTPNAIPPIPADDKSAPINVADVIAKAQGKPVPERATLSKQPEGVVKRTNQFFIDPKSIIRREGWNPRFEFGEIEALAESIRLLKERDPSTGGLLNDIRVKRIDGGKFELVDGDRRLTAIESLMKKGETFPIGIPAKLEAKDADDLELLLRTFMANTGKPLLPMEQANAFQRMREGGMSLDDIKKATGASIMSIVGAFALLEGDQAIKDALKDGVITGGMAKDIAVHARGDVVKQKELVEQAKAAGKDAKKKRALKVAIEQARVAKAAKRGVVLKMRALNNDQLSAIGMKLSEILMGRMTAVGLAADCNLEEWMDGVSDEMKVAFTFGALQGMKAAAGVVVKFQ